jgi:hypothetical protein
MNLPHILSKMRRCYICGSAVGTVLLIIALNIEDGWVKKTILLISLILFVAGGVLIAIDQNRIINERKRKRDSD